MVSHTPASHVCYPLGLVGIGFVAFGVNSGGDGAGGDRAGEDGAGGGQRWWGRHQGRCDTVAGVKRLSDSEGSTKGVADGPVAGWHVATGGHWGCWGHSQGWWRGQRDGGCAFPVQARGQCRRGSWDVGRG